MKKLKTILLLTLLITSMNAFAQGDVRNGGDEVGIEFVKLARESVEDIRLLGIEKFPEVKLTDIKMTVDQMQVFVVEKAPEQKQGEIEQFSSVENIPASQIILVYRARWNAIADVKVKKGLALHEVLCLMGLEKTGFYPISGRYQELLKTLTPPVKEDLKEKGFHIISCSQADYSCPKIGENNGWMTMPQVYGRICTAFQHLKTADINTDSIGDDFEIAWTGTSMYYDFLSQLKYAMNACTKTGPGTIAYYDLALTMNTFGSHPKVRAIAEHVLKEQTVYFEDVPAKKSQK